MKLKELAILQEKLRAIDKLSNYSHKLPAKTKNDVSYLIHQIIDASYYNSDLARQVMSYGLLANKDLFITVKN